MGSCSSKKVANQVAADAIVSKAQINQSAHDHLQGMLAADPLSASMSSKAFNNTMQKIQKQPKTGAEARVVDQDKSGYEEDGGRLHEPLWRAIEANDLAAATHFFSLNEIEEQNMYDAAGQSMLHKAAQLGHPEIIMLLLERTGAKADLVNSHLATPLHVACRANKENIVKLLIGCGVEANVQDEHGQTPLLVSCIHGYTRLVQQLVESSIAGHLPEPIETDTPDHRGLTPLNCAAIKGDLELAKLLIQRGQADVNQTSPKGCSPLIYAGRGGFAEFVRYLLEKRASPLKQDNAGCTVLHHAIEKGHVNVLEVMLEHGVDVYSAIELADNAGRTPLFEAVEMEDEGVNQFGVMPSQSDDQPNKSASVISILTKPRQRHDGGFGAKVNILNYNGQSPLFQAVKSGNFESVKILIEMGAHVDLNQGELVKENEQQDENEEEDEEESILEKCFMEAFMNCSTPLMVASVLGFDQIALYLLQKGADINIQTSFKRYSAPHLTVLANKPEMLIELLTKSNANPLLEDSQGRTLLDLIYAYNPTYVESFQALIENLQVHRMTNQISQDTATTVARHYINPDEERAIKGAAQDEIEGFYEREESKISNGGLVRDPSHALLKKGFDQVQEEDIMIDDEASTDARVEACFGRKVALGLIAADWKIKEMSLKFITKKLEKLLAKVATGASLAEVVEACTAAVAQVAREKVMKVFNAMLNMLNLMISSSKIDQDPASIAMFRQVLTQEHVIPRLLLKSEESNTRLTNKIHEALLDLSYHPKIGEDLASQAILERIDQHHNARPSVPKGLLAQLALLFKFINSYGIEVPSQGQEQTDQVLTVQSVLAASVPAIANANKDVKNTAIKILLDVQRLTGQVKDTHLSKLPEKTRELVKEKVFQVKCEVEMNQTQARKKEQNMMSMASKGGDSLAQMLAAGQSINVVNIGEGGFENRENVDLSAATENFEKSKAVIMEKGQHKDWQQRELALNAMHECFEVVPQKILKDNQDFLETCCIILKNCMEENNIQIYLVGIQTASVFFQKALSNEPVMEALSSMLRQIVMRTTDTNTRVRKKSIDLVNQIWDSNGLSSAVAVMKTGQKQRDHDSISLLIANVLCDSQLNEKAIVGRLSLFIKKSMMIESGEELNKRAFKMILGKDYEELTEFACQWCMHKNTKVRQCALKLIVEICRLNYIDPRGQPFKQRIINFILGLRPSLRDPLLTKINETCAQEQSGQADDGSKSTSEPFINVNEMELNLATKGRAASMDVRRGHANVRKAAGGANQSKQPDLPQISGLPGIVVQASAGGGAVGQKPTIVLPHSEPLNESQKAQAQPYINLFGEEIMTCFYSQTWSTRAASIAKIEEQLHNLDPNRRDAMYGEINRSNQPPELTVKVFFKLIAEGYKDPNLKNYLCLLELLQQALSTYFKYLQSDQVQAELIPLVKNTIAKTSDLKAKVREASINFCLYLSHQSPIGPEVMLNSVIEELSQAFKPQQQQAQPSAAATSSFGSSHMIASCLQLMNQFQQQTKLVNAKDTYLFNKYLQCINEALRHTNPNVRKQGAALFKVLFLQFGEELFTKLVNQKPQLVQKLTQESKQEAASSASSVAAELLKPDPAKDQQRMMAEQLSDNFASLPQIRSLLNNNTEVLKELRMPNPKKRLKAIVDIKKLVQKKLATVSQTLTRDLVEPLQILLRELLRDENTDVYLEALNLLKFVVGSLATHLSALDLHLMMGQFISLTVTNASSANMRIRVASDKVIIYFAKHTNIGSYIVAKEVMKNIERTNRALVTPFPASMSPEDALTEITQRKEILIRHYNILYMLLQQFSIVLCYQPDFYSICLTHIANTMNASPPEEDLAIKSICTQIIITLFNIDTHLLEQGVNKLDFTKKTPIRKVMIEHENMSAKHKNLQVVTNNDMMSHQGPTHGPNFVANANDREGSPQQSMHDTQQSFASFNRSNFAPSEADQQFSPQSAARIRRSQRDFGQTDTGQSWNRQSSEVRSSRKANELGMGRGMGSAYGINRQESMKLTGQSWMDKRSQLADGNNAMLPDIGGHVRRPPMNESFHSMGRMTGAAGFKRDSVVSRGVPDPGLTGFSYNDPNSNRGPAGSTHTSHFGMSSPQEDQLPGQHAKMSPMRQDPNRRSNNQRIATGAAAAQDNRPPKYEPTRRETGGARGVGMRDSLNAGDTSSTTTGYQPKTSFSYVPSVQVAQEQKQQSIFGRRNSRGDSGSRYQPSQMSGGGSATGFSAAGGASMPVSRGYGGVSSAAASSIASPMLAKPPMMPSGASKPKAFVPPVATFQTKTYDYEQPKKSGRGNGPDMMM